MFKKEVSVSYKSLLGLSMLLFIVGFFVGGYIPYEELVQENVDLVSQNNELKKALAKSYEVTIYGGPFSFFVPYNTTKRLPGSKDWHIRVIKDEENEHAFLYQKEREHAKYDLLQGERSPAASEEKSTYYIPAFEKTGVNNDGKITEGIGFYLIQLKEPYLR